jgi:hypothetical protein
MLQVKMSAKLGRLMALVVAIFSATLFSKLARYYVYLDPQCQPVRYLLLLSLANM